MEGEKGKQETGESSSFKIIDREAWMGTVELNWQWRHCTSKKALKILYAAIFPNGH
jgi:hypothetical protein